MYESFIVFSINPKVFSFSILTKLIIRKKYFLLNLACLAAEIKTENITYR